MSWATYDFVLSKQEGEGQIEIDAVVGLKQGNLAPDFELSTLNNEIVKLSDFKGKPVMLNFWATWCPPCRAEMPDFQKLYDDHDVHVLAINLFITEDDVGNVERFVDQFELTFPVVLDESGEVAKMYKIQPIPTSYIIDEHGLVQNKVIGALNYELMTQFLAKLHK